MPRTSRRPSLLPATATVAATAAVVAVYLSHEAVRGCVPPTVNRKLAAIGHRHRQAGLVAPQRAEGGSVVLNVLAHPPRARPPTGPRGGGGHAARG